MSLEFCVLASGSMGNCGVLRTPGGVVLIDAGIGPRTTAARLVGTGVGIAHVRSICLTHLDSDHFKASWIRTIVARGIRVFCHSGCIAGLRALCGEAFDGHVNGFDGCFEPLSGLRVRPIALAHDRTGSHGFIIEGFGGRVGYATDLGRVPPELIERFAGVNILAIESNYDPDMQRSSGRPWFLQRRIMGGRGHLSNEQCLLAIRQILRRCEAGALPLPEHIVLLHRSRDCNCPRLVRRLFGADRRIAPRLTLAEQFSRSEWVRPRGDRERLGEQLLLAWA